MSIDISHIGIGCPTNAFKITFISCGSALECLWGLIALVYYEIRIYNLPS